MLSSMGVSRVEDKEEFIKEQKRMKDKHSFKWKYDKDKVEK